jgi:hypothetical protein
MSQDQAAQKLYACCEDYNSGKATAEEVAETAYSAGQQLDEKQAAVMENILQQK